MQSGCKKLTYTCVPRASSDVRTWPPGLLATCLTMTSRLPTTAPAHNNCQVAYVHLAQLPYLQMPYSKVRIRTMIKALLCITTKSAHWPSTSTKVPRARQGTGTFA